MFRGINLEDLNFEKRSYNSLKAYAQSKLANVIFTRELARRLKGNALIQQSIHGIKLNPAYRIEN